MVGLVVLKQYCRENFGGHHGWFGCIKILKKEISNQKQKTKKNRENNRIIQNKSEIARITAV
jgi:hypothetical protein